jgi:hypothetical protein
MKPVIVARLGDQMTQSQPDDKDIKNPVWTDELVLKRDAHQNDTISLEVRNFENNINDSKVLATAFLSLTPTLLLTRQRMDLKFWSKGKFAGTILLEYQLQPEGGQTPGCKFFVYLMIFYLFISENIPSQQQQQNI